MKKLISAATSLCMAASMVGAVVPATVGAADATKGFSIKTYDINNPSAASGKSEITLDLTKDFKDGKAVIPCALYYSESTNNSTGSLQVCLTTDSKDISFVVYDPTKQYGDREKTAYTLGGVDFTTNCYLSFAGYCKSARAGYKAAGKYVLASAESQSAANTDNYFIGCSWMNNGTDYSWAGETSDAYPFYVFDTIVPDTIKPGTYKVTYCDYNTDQTGVNDNPSPMVESDGERYTKKGGNLKLNELTINVKGVGETTTPTTTSTTTTSKTTTTTSTTKPVSSTTTQPVVTDEPVVLDGDVNFKFVDENGDSTVKIESGKGAKFGVDVLIDAGNNDISSLDVQFKTSKGIKITDILESANAFDGVTVSSNLDELRASYVTLDGDKPMKATKGESAFMLDVEVPAGTPDGIYYVDFDNQCKVFKDNTSFNYKTAAQPLKIVVGNPDPSQITTTTTTSKTTTSTTTTTTTPVVSGDVNFEFVDENGKNSIEVDNKKGAKISIDVNINAGNNDISSLDVQFQKSKGFKITDILESANAFDGVTVSSNLDEYRASYVTLDGDKPMKAANGESAFMLDIEVPAGTPAGTYYVDFADQCKVFKDNTSFNYKTSSKPYKIVVTGEGTVTPDPEGDVTFEFVDENGNNSIEVDSTKGAKISLDVNINAGNNDISSLDVQFQKSKGFKITDILESANAFDGVTVSSNLDEYRASYVTLDGDKPMKANNGESAFMLDIEVPAGTPVGTYYVDFADQCKVFKDNTSFNYETASKPYKIVVTGSSVTPDPDPEGDVTFEFVDENGNNSIEVDNKKGAKISLDVNINAGNNDISSLDVQFQKSKGFKITDILESANAFDGVTVSSNLDEYRASYVTLDGDKPMKANNGESAFMLDIEVPAGTPAGTYYVDFADQCKVFKDNTSFNYETASKPYKIVVTDDGSTIVDPEGDVNFKFVDENGNSTVKVQKGTKTTIAVDVLIDAGNYDISSLDVQFKTSDKNVKITGILESANAFDGVTVSSNLDEYRASYVTLDGDKPMKAVNGESAFMLDVEIPADLPAGKYTVGFGDQCKVFKDNTSFNYKTDFTPLTIIVEEGTTTTSTTSGTTTSTSTTSKTTTSTTSTSTTSKTTTSTTTSTSTTSTTTTTPPVSGKLNVTVWGDTNCDGVVNVADVVVLNRLLNDPSYVVKHPTTKADVTAQGKVNADVVDPQNKDGKNIDPKTVKLTGADSEAIAMFILEKGNIPQ